MISMYFIDNKALNLGTHQKINLAAYNLAFNKTKDVFLFPHYRQINRFSGVLGPDGIWFKGRGRYSTHMYNPKTRKGLAMKSAQKHYDKLVKELSRPRPKYRRAGFFAAFMLHYIVDGLNPAHQIGYKRKQRRKIDDWHDTEFDTKKHPLLNLKKSHMAFEFKVLKHYFFKKLKMGTIDEELLKHIKKEHPRKTIQRYLEVLAKEVYDLKIYYKYRKNGWTDEVIQLIDKKMMPLMVTACATIMKAAQIESRATISRS